MSVSSVQLSPDGDQPTVTVFFGQAQYGEYRVRLKSNGKKVLQGEGDNVDDVEDTFPLTLPLAELDGTVLAWWLLIAAPQEGEDELYSARVDISQNGLVVASFPYDGKFTDSKNIISAVKLAV